MESSEGNRSFGENGSIRNGKACCVDFTELIVVTASGVSEHREVELRNVLLRAGI